MDEILVDVIADLTDIIARIVRLNAPYYERVPVQHVPSVPAHDDVGRCQHICSASPQYNVISWVARGWIEGEEEEEQRMMHIRLETVIIPDYTTTSSNDDDWCSDLLTRILDVAGQGQRVTGHCPINCTLR